jgi:hypothetical protein
MKRVLLIIAAVLCLGAIPNNTVTVLSGSDPCATFFNTLTPTIYLDYLDTNNITKDGANAISAWKSKTTAVTFTAANKPTWTSSGVYFDGGVPNNYMSSTSAISDIFAAQGKTIFIVGNFSVVLGKSILCDRTAFMWKTEFEGTLGKYRMYNNDGVGDYAHEVTAYTTGTNAVWESMHDATNIWSCENGTCNIVTASGATSDLTGLLGIGRNATTPTGYLMALLTFNEALPADLRSRVRACLGKRYGVVVQ